MYALTSSVCKKENHIMHETATETETEAETRNHTELRVLSGDSDFEHQVFWFHKWNVSRQIKKLHVHETETETETETDTETDTETYTETYTETETDTEPVQDETVMEDEGNTGEWRQG